MASETPMTNVILPDLNIRNISFFMIFSVGGLINFLGGYSLWSQSCTFSIEFGNFDPGDSLRSYDKCQMALSNDRMQEQPLLISHQILDILTTVRRHVSAPLRATRWEATILEVELLPVLPGRVHFFAVEREETFLQKRREI